MGTFENVLSFCFKMFQIFFLKLRTLAIVLKLSLLMFRTYEKVSKPKCGFESLVTEAKCHSETFKKGLSKMLYTKELSAEDRILKHFLVYVYSKNF